MTASSYDYLLKILTLGDSGVGKSSIISRYTDNQFFSNYTTTVGIDFREKRLIFKEQDGNLIRQQRVLLQLWDTAGQERFFYYICRYRSLTIAFFRDAMAFIVVFDLTNEHSLINVRNWIDQLKTHSNDDSPNLILCGNKVDLEENRQISYQQAQEFAHDNKMDYFETSALTGFNIDAMFDHLVALIMRRMDKIMEKSLKNRSNFGNTTNLDSTNFGKLGS